MHQTAKTPRLSDNRVLGGTHWTGHRSTEAERESVFELAERFRAASDPE